MVKHVNPICIVTFVTCLLMVNCNSSQTNQPNGWYHLEDHAEVITGNPIVTVKDFDFLQLDSGKSGDTNEMVYMITGKVKQEQLKTFGDETEKAIGKKIGFFYNGKVLSAPSPNVRLDSGYFSITLYPDYSSDQAHTIYNNLNKERNSD